MGSLVVGIRQPVVREERKRPGVDSDRSLFAEEHPMFTHVGLPQFGLIVVLLIIIIGYTQRHRF